MLHDEEKIYCGNHGSGNTGRRHDLEKKTGIKMVEEKIHTKEKGRTMRKRNHVIPVRLNAKELRYLEEQVKKSGLAREEYLRTLIMGGEVHAKPCEHHADLLRKIAGLCNNANQLAHVANASGSASQESLREMLRISRETWQLVKEEW